jgi:hypothetical protein
MAIRTKNPDGIEANRGLSSPTVCLLLAWFQPFKRYLLYSIII